VGPTLIWTQGFVTQNVDDFDAASSPKKPTGIQCEVYHLYAACPPPLLHLVPHYLPHCTAPSSAPSPALRLHACLTRVVVRESGVGGGWGWGVGWGDASRSQRHVTYFALGANRRAITAPRRKIVAALTHGLRFLAWRPLLSRVSSRS
jgi:hypothetical protein